MFAVQLSFAQVKRQYQDETFSQTTVVIKDDQATDLEVLSQIDLDDVGMDQVIRITTEKVVIDEPEVPVAQASTPAPPVVEVAPEDRKPKPRRWAKRTKKAVKKEKPVKAEPIVAAETPEEKPVVSQGGYAKKDRVERKVRRSKKVQSKVKKRSKRKNRRFKKAKRKKHKKKYSCFKF